MTTPEPRTMKGPTMTVPTAVTIWAHDDCGQEVDENGWHHVDPTSKCTGLYDCAVVGVSINPAQRTVTSAVTGPAWIHDACGQVVIDHEDGWSHVDNVSGCTTLGDAIPGINIIHVPAGPVDTAQDAALVIAESTVTADRVATDLAATLTPADLYQLFRKLEEKVASATYPPLMIRRRDLTGLSEDDIAEWGLFEFVCPYCGNVREEMTSLNVSFLGQYSDEIGERGANANEIHFDYDTDPGFHDLVYLSACCDQPVAFPAGWTET